jgi:hypothetical protein
MYNTQTTGVETPMKTFESSSFRGFDHKTVAANYPIAMRFLRTMNLWYT